MSEQGQENAPVSQRLGAVDQKRKKSHRGSRQQRKKANNNDSNRKKGPIEQYTPIVRNNDNLISYYKLQSFLNEGELEQFLEGLRETLPASFRINNFDPGQAYILKRLVEGPQFNELQSTPADSLKSGNGPAQNGDKSDCVETTKRTDQPACLEPLTWYPKRLAWQMNITRIDLRKSPLLQQLHQFLMAETDNGFISRQEAVSMIPPLLLDVERGHNVLDMCAAPGSKTAQLLEYLKHDIKSEGSLFEEQTRQDGYPLFDDGLVVANDVDNKRCYMLVHQSNRLNSPNCIIINQDASRMPDMKTIDPNDTNNFVNLKFQRVLCDVPCSGDGTVRKNPDVWRKWTVGNANNFHGIQCKILKRGIELLEKDGLLVYSTCSMNPVEDEAVVANLLRVAKGTVVLEDISRKLDGLKYRPGVDKWVVMSRDMQVVESPDQVPEEHSTQIYPSLFPPKPEECESFALNRCLRILPHLQNTGAFFVAALRKLTSGMPWEQVQEQLQTVSNEATQNLKKQDSVNTKKRRFAGFKEDPFIFMEPTDPDWISIKNVYGLSDDFPVNQLVHRCTSGKKRSIYLVSKKTRAFILANREEPDRSDFVKIINGGMRLFNRAATEAGFRICQDGVNEILPYIKDDIKVPITKDDLIGLLERPAVSFDSLSSAQRVKETVKPGSFILIYTHQQDDVNDQGPKNITMPLVAWKGERSVALYVAKTYRVHLRAVAQLRIGQDVEAVHKDTSDKNIDNASADQVNSDNP